MINEAFFNKFTVEDINYNENRVLIILKAKDLHAKCTCCGHATSKVHSRYDRKVLDLPMLDKYTSLKIKARRFFCTNDSCERKIFSEEFNGFLLKYRRLTERLTDYLINFGLSQPANQVQRLLKNYIPVSSSSLLRITKNYNISVKYDAEFIGIDDFSFKKGITFGSIICDLKTGKPIDIINSRNLDDVVEHLKLYKNVKVISRDRSTTYAKAIKDALPKASQVADRFHIIHNFLEGACDFLKRYIGKCIKIVEKKNDDVTIEKTTYVNNDKIIEKKGLIIKVQDLYKQGTPIRQICRELSISRNTVRRYLKIENIEAVRYNYKPIPFDFHKDFIIDLLVKKTPYKEILLELEKLGVTYSYSSLAKYANSLKKEGLPSEVKERKIYIYNRFNLIKIFWNYETIDTDVFKILTLVLEEFPQLDSLFLAIASLKQVFSSKSCSLLEEWINFNSNSEINEIKSFVYGVTKDYESVTNAVTYSESNGVLEGNVNKLKTIKRSMFGRASFNLLRKKVIANI